MDDAVNSLVRLTVLDLLKRTLTMRRHANESLFDT